MEQITVDKQNCCVILLCRKQEARFLSTYCGNWPVETQTYCGTPQEEEFTRDWRASVRLRTKLTKNHFRVADTIYSMI
jgi:hypothetical protein